MHSVLNVKAGDIFGRLEVLEATQSGYSKNPSVSKCKCECGNIITIKTIQLWKLRSCGCIKKRPKYHKTHPKMWRAWQGIKARCLRKTNKRYPEWGGRGIKVCDGIRGDIEVLIKMIGFPPSPDHSVDRKENGGNYSCGGCDHCKSNGWVMNVRWATALEQSQNRDVVVKYLFMGEELCISEVCRRLNLPMKTIWSRIERGWSFERAINTKIKTLK